MEHSAEWVASSYVKAGDLVRNHQGRGQWLERAGVRDALMRPVPVVELLELPPSEVASLLERCSELKRQLVEFACAPRFSGQLDQGRCCVGRSQRAGRLIQ